LWVGVRGRREGELGQKKKKWRRRRRRKKKKKRKMKMMTKRKKKKRGSKKRMTMRGKKQSHWKSATHPTTNWKTRTIGEVQRAVAQGQVKVLEKLVDVAEMVS
jgi:hypothetical protein